MRRFATLAAALLVLPLAAYGQTDSVGPPFLPDSSIAYSPAQSIKFYTDVTFGSTCYLAVWDDDRAGDGFDVYAARLLPDGTLLDSAPVAVGNDRTDDMAPAVAFDGTNFLVVWFSGPYGEQAVLGARVSPAGVLLDSGGFVISNEAEDQVLPDVDFNGTDYFVAWADARNGAYTRIFGSRVTPSAQVLDPGGFEVNPGSYTAPSVASNGDRWLVVWQDNSQAIVGGARIAANGTVLDPAGITIGSGADIRTFPDVTWDGQDWFAVWQDRRSGGSLENWSVYGARVDTSGQVLDPQGIAIANSDSKYEGQPGIGTGDSLLLVTWKDNGNNQLTASRVTRGGVVVDPGGKTLGSMPNNPSSVAFDGANWLALGHGGVVTNGRPHVRATRVNPDCVALDPFPNITVSLAGGNHACTGAAFNGSNHLAVWQDQTNGYYTYNIRASRITPDGTVLDPEGIMVSDTFAVQNYVTVGGGNGRWLAAWFDRRRGQGELWGARIDSNGAVLDPNAFPISSGTWNNMMATIGFDGANWLVVWKKYEGFPDTVAAARVSRDGVVLDPTAIKVATTTGVMGWERMTSYGVAFDGTNYLVAWPDRRNGNWDVYGARVSTAGQVLDPDGIAICRRSGEQGQPRLAFGAGNYLAVWRDSAGGSNDIYAARLTPAGVLLDSPPIALSTARGAQTTPTVGFDGTHYIVSWMDGRTNLSDIYCARVSINGTVLDPNGILVSDEHRGEIRPSVSANPAGPTLIAYTGYVVYPYQAQRALGTMVNWPSGIEESPKPQASSHKPAATLIRGILWLGAGHDRENGDCPAANSMSCSEGLSPVFALLDASGRKACDLHPGPNDVSHLPPGIYFATVYGARNAVYARKVILTD